MQLVSLGYKGPACLGHVLATGQLALVKFRDTGAAGGREYKFTYIQVFIVLHYNSLLNTFQENGAYRRDPNPTA
eukprot:scaffold252208_cov31-Prasinocladus_malaysianus.AAC.1